MENEKEIKEGTPNETTQKAMEEMENGKSSICDNYEDYLRKVKDLE
jgi:hypothetical protein